MKNKNICSYCNKNKTVKGHVSYCITCYRKKIRPLSACKRCQKVKVNINGYCPHCYNYIGGYYKNKHTRLPQRYVRSIRKQLNYKCHFCEEQREGMLDIHHIDKNKKNNNINNLIHLCSNHHRALHLGYVKFNPVDKSS